MGRRGALQSRETLANRYRKEREPFPLRSRESRELRGLADAPEAAEAAGERRGSAAAYRARRFGEPPTLLDSSERRGKASPSFDQLGSG